MLGISNGHTDVSISGEEPLRPQIEEAAPIKAGSTSGQRVSTCRPGIRECFYPTASSSLRFFWTGSSADGFSVFSGEPPAEFRLIVFITVIVRSLSFLQTWLNGGQRHAKTKWFHTRGVAGGHRDYRLAHRTSSPCTFPCPTGCTRREGREWNGTDSQGLPHLVPERPERLAPVPRPNQSIHRSSDWSPAWLRPGKLEEEFHRPPLLLDDWPGLLQLRHLHQPR